MFYSMLFANYFVLFFAELFWFFVGMGDDLSFYRDPLLFWAPLLKGGCAFRMRCHLWFPRRSSQLSHEP